MLKNSLNRCQRNLGNLGNLQTHHSICNSNASNTIFAYERSNLRYKEARLKLFTLDHNLKFSLYRRMRAVKLTNIYSRRSAFFFFLFFHNSLNRYALLNYVLRKTNEGHSVSTRVTKCPRFNSLEKNVLFFQDMTFLMVFLAITSRSIMTVGYPHSPIYYCT